MTEARATTEGSSRVVVEGSSQTNYYFALSVCVRWVSPACCSATPARVPVPDATRATPQDSMRRAAIRAARLGRARLSSSSLPAPDYDVVVVGGGVMGASVAYHTHQPGRDRRTVPHQSPTTVRLSPTTPVAYHTVPHQVRLSPTTRHWPTRRCACAWSSMAKVPQLSSCASSGRASRLRLGTPRGEACTLSAQPLLRVLELAASRAADVTAVDHSGGRAGHELRARERDALGGRHPTAVLAARQHPGTAAAPPATC